MAQRESEPSSGEQAKPVRGKPFSPGVSGNPLGGKLKGKRFHELYDGICADFGGEARLSTLQKSILGQAVRLLVKGERVRKTDEQIRLANAASRLLTAPAPPIPPLSFSR